jgi:hypothetical protein
MRVWVRKRSNRSAIIGELLRSNGVKEERAWENDLRISKKPKDRLAISMRNEASTNHPYQNK